MSKHDWHVARKGEEPKEVRHYKHLSKMYQFVLRNPAMFENRILTVYDNGIRKADVSWEYIKQQVDSEIKEIEARKSLNAAKLLEETK